MKPEKDCPFCGETILAVAIRCRYCQADLTTDDRRQTAEPVPDSRSSTLGSQEVSDVLSTLVDRSLVAVDSATGRFRLLETVRQYSRDRLFEQGEGAALRGRHRDCFLSMAEEAWPKLDGPDQAHWLDVLEEEHDNLRAALRFCLEEPASPEGPEGGGEAEKGLQLAAAIHRFWITRAHVTEGRELLDEQLSNPRAQRRTKARANAINAAGVLAYIQGDYELSRALYEECLEIRQTLGDQNAVAASLNNLANTVWELGDIDSAYTIMEEALRINRSLGNRSQVAANLGNTGQAYEVKGDYPRARSLVQEALAINRELGNRAREAFNLFVLGRVATHEGDASSARALLAHGLAIHRDLGDRANMAEHLEAFASICMKEGSAGDAVRLWGTASAVREEVGTRLTDDDRAVRDHEEPAARALLGDAGFDAAWAKGRAMTMEQAIELALEGGADRASEFD